MSSFTPINRAAPGPSKGLAVSTAAPPASQPATGSSVQGQAAQSHGESGPPAEPTSSQCPTGEDAERPSGPPGNKAKKSSACDNCKKLKKCCTNKGRLVDRCEQCLKDDRDCVWTAKDGTPLPKSQAPNTDKDSDRGVWLLRLHEDRNAFGEEVRDLFDQFQEKSRRGWDRDSDEFPRTLDDLISRAAAAQAARTTRCPSKRAKKSSSRPVGPDGGSHSGPSLTGATTTNAGPSLTGPTTNGQEINGGDASGNGHSDNHNGSGTVTGATPVNDGVAGGEDSPRPISSFLQTVLIARRPVSG